MYGYQSSQNRVQPRDDFIRSLIDRKPKHICVSLFNKNWSHRDVIWLEFDLDAPHRIARFNNDYFKGQKKQFAVNKVIKATNGGTVCYDDHTVKVWEEPGKAKRKSEIQAILKSIRDVSATSEDKEHPIVTSNDSFTTTLCHVCCKFNRNHQSYITKDGITICSECVRYGECKEEMTLFKDIEKSPVVDIRKVIWVDDSIGCWNHDNYKLKHEWKYDTENVNYESAQRARMVKLQGEMDRIAFWIKGEEMYREEGKIADSYQRLKRAGRFVHRWFYNGPRWHMDMDGMTYGSIYHSDWKFIWKYQLWKQWKKLTKSREHCRWALRKHKGERKFIHMSLEAFFREHARMNGNTIFSYGHVVKEFKETVKKYPYNWKRKIASNKKKMWILWLKGNPCRGTRIYANRDHWYFKNVILKKMMKNFKQNNMKYPLQRLKDAWRIWEGGIWTTHCKRYYKTKIKVNHKNWYHRNVILKIKKKKEKKEEKEKEKKVRKAKKEKSDIKPVKKRHVEIPKAETQKSSCVVM